MLLGSWALPGGSAVITFAATGSRVVSRGTAVLDGPLYCCQKRAWCHTALKRAGQVCSVRLLAAKWVGAVLLCLMAPETTASSECAVTLRAGQVCFVRLLAASCRDQTV